MVSERHWETDVLVIGAGMAGLFAAIKAREEGVRVALVDKNQAGRSGSTVFADGLFSVCSPDCGHDAGQWMARVNAACEYLNDPDWTRITLEESGERYQDLTRWGVQERRGPDGSLLAYRRPEVFGPLEAFFLGRGWTFLPRVRQEAERVGALILDRVMVTDLLEEEGRVVGALGFHTRTGDCHVIHAGATVMSTGTGALRDTPSAMGPLGFLSYDGEAMAYRAGARIGGKEFACGGTGAFAAPRDQQAKVDTRGRHVSGVAGQYPAWVPYGPALSFLDSWVDAEGNRVSRMNAPVAAHEGRGPILWDLDAADARDLEATLLDIRESKTEFRLERAGIDLTKRGLHSGAMRFEGAPGHTVFGGTSGIASTGFDCTTDLPGLYAAGDVYHSKAIDATYPGLGFALRNAAVTGARAGRAAGHFARAAEKPVVNAQSVAKLKERLYAPLARSGGFDPRWVEQQLLHVALPYYILIVKHGDRLQAAATLTEFLRRHILPKLVARDPHELRLAHEAKSRVLNVEMMLRSSLFRTESRGIHYREDFPRRADPEWLADVSLRDQHGAMSVTREPIPREWWPDLSRDYRDRYFMRFPGDD